MKPIKSIKVKSPEEDPTQHRTGEPDPEGEARRKATLKRLHAADYQPAEGMPTTLHRAGIQGKLRPTREIAQRRLALHALNFWVFAQKTSSEDIEKFIARNDLRGAMTPGNLGS